MLRKKSRTTNTTNNRRTRVKESLEPLLPADVNALIWDPPDMPGHEMNKHARVWRTYNKETDGWDKEMVEQQNGSMDVLLIFAALFSAISTAFIIESLKDLKPDPAETSSQTLLAILDKLDVSTDGRLMFLPQQDATTSSVFQPSRTAIVVNILWILSLSLSVGVSLIAMLAKDWCHKFMSGRSGQPYDRARRRQKRWNGIKNWRMRGVLTHLPIALHASLLLFAAGLCVRLWEIDKRIAMPIVTISASATLIYIFMTILPLFFDDCPYKTPATDSHIAKGLLCLGLMTWVFLWSCLALAVTLVLELALLPVLVAVLLGYLAIVLAIAAAAAALFVAFVALFVTLGTIFVIGWLGYEAICWLWRRCHRRRVETRTPQAEPIPGSGLSLHPEANSQPTTSSPPVDSTVDETRTAVSSVSTTVQMFNIALRTWGNNKNLPLATIRATMTTVRTLEAMTRSAGSWLYQPKRLIRITESLLDDSDPRAAEVLMDSVTSDMIAWILTESQDIKSIDIALQAVSGASSLLPLRPLALPQAIDLVDSQLSCFKQLNEGQCKDKGITILSKALTYCRTYKILALDSKSRQPWDRWKSSNPQQNSANVLEFIGLYTGLLDAVHRDKRSNQDLEIAAAIAAMPFCHWGHNASVDLTEKLEIAPKIIAARLRDYLTTENSEATLCRLVDSTAHYLIGLLPRRGLRFEHSLPTLLVQAFLLTRDSSSEVDYDAATILSATAFALYPYQGGETRSQDVDAREKRALKVLTHYKTRQPNVSEATKPPAPGSAPLTLRQRIVRRAQEMEKTSAQVMEQAMEQGMAQAAQTDDTTAGDSKMTKLNVLFAFGFLGVLHEIDFEYLAQADIDKLSTLFLEVTETCGVFNAPGQPQTSIHTLPNNVSLRECVILAAYRCLLAISDPYHTPRSVSTNIQRSFELFLWPNLGDGRGDPRLYFLALSTLCYAGSEEIRGCCMDLIAQQPISTDPFRHLVNSYDGQNLLTRLCYSLRDTNSSRLVPLVLGKFRLLVAHIMLARDISLPDRKAALLPLLECASYLGELHLDPHETNDRLPDEKSILHHVKRSEGESGPNSILRTMRLIFRFCHAASDTSADVAPIWQERLNELREHFSTKNFAAIAHPRQESSLVWDDTWAPLSEDTL